LLRNGNHGRATIDGDHAGTVAHQPVGVPAVTATGVENINVIDPWQETQVVGGS